MLREILVVCLCLLLGARVGAEPVGGGAMVAKNLRCEGGVNPLGVGELRPRLSWNLSGGKDSESMYQSAYRVIVATSPALLALSPHLLRCLTKEMEISGIVAKYRAESTSGLNILESL